MIARFAHVSLPSGFFDDWISAAGDESTQWHLMSDCLEAGAAIAARSLPMPACGAPWNRRRAT